MTNEANRSIPRNLALALTLTAMLTLAAVPCAAASATRGEPSAPTTLWTFDAQALWSVFSGWIDSVWQASGAFIDPNGVDLRAAQSTGPSTGADETSRLWAASGAFIDPNGRDLKAAGISTRTPGVAWAERDGAK